MKTFKKRRRPKRRTIKRVYRGGVGEDMCSICHEEFIPGDNVYTHPACNNKFHMDCIKQWCSGKDDCPCPMCRGTVQPEEMFSFEERLSSYKEICDKEKRELELFTQQEVEDLEDKLIALELQRNTQVTNLQAQYNANDAKRLTQYKELADRCNAIDKKRVAEYKELAEDYNALHEECVTTTKDLLAAYKEYEELVNKYNANDARRDAEYNALVNKYNANNAIDKERIVQYNALSDSFNALRAQYLASQNK